jgi:hypothetical protein
VNSLETTVATVQAGLLINQPNNTTGAYPLQITSTWNNAAQGFAAIVVQITDTASAAGSYLELMQVGGVNKWLIDKTGKVTVGSADAAFITTGTLPPARLASAGTPSVTTWLRGDGAWNTLWTAIAKSTNTTIGTENFVQVDTTAAALTLTLPVAASVVRQEYLIIVASGANACTIQRQGTDTIAGGGAGNTTYTLTGLLKYVRLVAISSGWFIAGSN